MPTTQPHSLDRYKTVRKVGLLLPGSSLPGTIRWPLPPDAGRPGQLGTYLLMARGREVGRFALFVQPDQHVNGASFLSIGDYQCVDHLGYALELFRWAASLARERGVSLLVGPMGASTWEPYRLVVPPCPQPFLMEPRHPEYYFRQWKQAGFNPLKTFESRIDRQLQLDVPTMQATRAHLEEKGWRIRGINPDRWEEELGAIAALCDEGFAGSFLFRSLPVAAFVEAHRSLKHIIDPELILLAEDNHGSLQAFLFAVPDRHYGTEKTLVIKTLVRRPGISFPGLPLYLTREVTERARRRGYQQVIHALMREGNASLQISHAFDSQLLRRYVLLYKHLEKENI